MIHSLKVTETEITSTGTPHTARRVADGWRVSWMSWRRPVDRNQAVTAMTVATVVASGVLADPKSRWWAAMNGWVHELHVTLSHAVRSTVPPDLCDTVFAALRVHRTEVDR